jgi:RNA-binding protein
LDKEQKKRLRSEGQALDATVNIGKAGVTEGVMEELDTQLRRNHLVKVRLQRSAVGEDKQEKDIQATELAALLSAELVERRGHTVLLYRRKALR